jgi:hypothetical protein
MRAPVRPLSGRWPAGPERRLARFFWQDPSVVASQGASPDAFRTAMSAFYVGDTIKITGRLRRPGSRSTASSGCRASARSSSPTAS